MDHSVYGLVDLGFEVRRFVVVDDIPQILRRCW